jgi:adenylyltransferase/sulfurtransferase
MSPSRYARQTVLAEIGAAGQDALARARVLVVGAGGLGSPVLMYLSAAGLGQKAAGGYLTVIDDDTVDAGNLQRQILFNETDLGHHKALAAQRHLTALNGDIDLRALPVRLTAQNVLALFAEHDLIIDGADNFDTKYLINDAAVKLKRPVVYGSILGFEGQAGVFWAAHGPCYRCLYPEPPSPTVPNCAQFGTLGGVAGVIASIQVVEACKLALGLEHCRRHGLHPLIGQLLVCDTRDWTMQTLALPKNSHCPVCSQLPDAIRLPAASATTCPPATPSNLSMADLSDLTAKGVTYTLVDVREHAEWAAGHLDGAVHLPLARLLAAADPLKDLGSMQPFIVYCQQGVRSQTAVHFLRQRGLDARALMLDHP